MVCGTLSKEIPANSFSPVSYEEVDLQSLCYVSQIPNNQCLVTEPGSTVQAHIEASESTN